MDERDEIAIWYSPGGGINPFTEEVDVNDLPTHSDKEHTSSSELLMVHVRIQVDPSNETEFFKHLKRCYENVSAEPECTFFEITKSQDEPGVYRLVEGWSKSREWFETVSRPHQSIPSNALRA